jgi:hypothetical protein
MLDGVSAHGGLEIVRAERTEACCWRLSLFCLSVEISVRRTHVSLLEKATESQYLSFVYC